MASSDAIFDVKKIDSLLKEACDNLQVDDGDFIKSALIKYNAIIAGGFVLSAYAKIKFVSSDIDIYVHQKNAYQLIKHFTIYGMYCSDTYIPPPYDQSFFIKNNILSRTRLQRRDTNFDILVIPDNIELSHVSSNFDLTICQIWYDGKSVYATDKDHIDSSEGLLRKDYCISLYSTLNIFIINRIIKYIKRGFAIKYETSNDKDSQIKQSSKKLLDTDEEKWLVLFLYKNIIQNYYLQSRLRDLGDKTQQHMITLNVYNIEEYKNYIRNLVTTLNNTNNIENGLQYCLHTSLKYLYDRIEDGSSYFNIIQKYTKIYKCHILYFNERISSDKFNIKLIYEKLEKYTKVITSNFRYIDIILFQSYEDFDENKYMEDKNNILLISDEIIFCYTRSDLDQLLSNQSEFWFFECQGKSIPFERCIHNNNTTLTCEDKSLDKIGKDVYVKIPIDLTGLNGLVHIEQILSMLSSDHQIFILKNTEKSFTHTISWKNVQKNYRLYDFVSANHCQYGSNMIIFEILETDIQKGGNTRRRRKLCLV